MSTKLNEVMEVQSEIDDTQNRIDELKRKQSARLAELVEEQGGRSFEVDGTHYQVRKSGKSGNFFLCSSSVPFGSWLKKDNKRSAVDTQKLSQGTVEKTHNDPVEEEPAATEDDEPSKKRMPVISP